jgi:hypothetical protein
MPHPVLGAVTGAAWYSSQCWGHRFRMARRASVTCPRSCSHQGRAATKEQVFCHKHSSHSGWLFPHLAFGVGLTEGGEVSFCLYPSVFSVIHAVHCVAAYAPSRKQWAPLDIVRAHWWSWNTLHFSLSQMGRNVRSLFGFMALVHSSIQSSDLAFHI